MFARSGRLDDAVTHFRRALTLKPDLVAAHNNLANALAGVASLLLTKSSYNWDAMAGDGYDYDPVPIDDYRRERLQAREYWQGLAAQIANYSGGRWP